MDRLQYGDQVIVKHLDYEVLATYISGPSGEGDTIKLKDESGVPFEINGNAANFIGIYAYNAVPIDVVKLGDAIAELAEDYMDASLEWDEEVRRDKLDILSNAEWLARSMRGMKAVFGYAALTDAIARLEWTVVKEPLPKFDKALLFMHMTEAGSDTPK